jgi:hypothetical protein
MTRKPPIEVIRQLRNEVGYCCPVPDCTNPYLEWHHFNPTWHECNHHDPKGMIALCGEHHGKADAGAFTNEQLLKFKSNAQSHSKFVTGQFDWLRQDILAVVGGNYFVDTEVIIQIDEQPIIWFNRNNDGDLLLNIKMLTTTNEERLILEDNFWIAKGDFKDFECPPSGKLISATYNNGDYLRVEFISFDDLEALKKKYVNPPEPVLNLSFPLTAVEVHYKIGNTLFDLGPKHSSVGAIFKNCFFANNGGAAIRVNTV